MFRGHGDPRIMVKTFTVLAGTGKVVASQMLESTMGWEEALINQLKERLDRDGYLLIRQFLPSADILTARSFLLEALKCTLEAPPVKTRNIGLIDRQHLALSQPVLSVLESSLLFSLMEKLIGKEVITPAYKWLRAVGDHEFTGLHCDRVFMGRAPSMLTAWIPLGDVPIAQGPILVCRASHRSRAFEQLRTSYGQSTVGKDGTTSGWLTDNGALLQRLVNQYSVDWRTADMQAGDVVILHPEVMHMSAANISGSIRISCDTRWQPRCGARDPRFRHWHAAQGPVRSANGSPVDHPMIESSPYS